MRVRDRAPIFWDAGMDAELSRLCAQKLSCAVMANAISAKFNIIITRNSVIGRMHRLKIANGRRPTGRNRLKPRAAAPVAPKRKQGVLHPSFGDRTSKPLPKPVEAPVVISPKMHVSIFKHKDGQCRWPVTEVQPLSNFRMCGGKVMKTGCPYCEAHWRLAWVKYQKKVAA